MTKKDTKNFQTESQIRLFAINIIILVIITVSGYYGFTFWKENQGQKQKLSKEQVAKIQKEIGELKEEYKEALKKPVDEFAQEDKTQVDLTPIYKALEDNLRKIEELKEEISGLKTDLAKSQNRQKVVKSLVTYIDLRQKIFEGKPYKYSLSNFESLSNSDLILLPKVKKLKSTLSNYVTQKELQEFFNDIIPTLIATKKHDPNGDFISKMRHQISKLVVIRKIDGSAPGTLDEVIFKVQKSLENQDYKLSLEALESLEGKYSEALEEFLKNLSNSLELQEADQEILKYLESLG